MTQEEFIQKYNLKEITEPIKNSDGKYIEKLVGYEITLHSLGYDLHITIILFENTSDVYRLNLKNKCTTNQYYVGKEVFAMHTTELSLMEKITYDMINNYIKI